MLRAIFAHVSHRGAVAASRQLGYPKLFSRLCVKCPEPAIIGGPNENKAAGGCNTAAHSTRPTLESNVAQAGQRFVDAKSAGPGNLTFVNIDRHNDAIRTGVAWDRRAIWKLIGK